jgi:hypothetical protein
MMPPPAPIEGEGVIEVHALGLSGHRGRRLLCFGPLHHEVCQRLGLDCYLKDICYVKPHELKSPLGNLSHGKAVPDNLTELM